MPAPRSRPPAGALPATHHRQCHRTAPIRLRELRGARLLLLLPLLLLLVSPTPALSATTPQSPAPPRPSLRPSPLSLSNNLTITLTSAPPPSEPSMPVSSVDGGGGGSIDGGAVPVTVWAPAAAVAGALILAGGVAGAVFVLRRRGRVGKATGGDPDGDICGKDVEKVDTPTAPVGDEHNASGRGPIPPSRALMPTPPPQQKQQRRRDSEQLPAAESTGLPLSVVTVSTCMGQQSLLAMGGGPPAGGALRSEIAAAAAPPACLSTTTTFLAAADAGLWVPTPPNAAFAGAAEDAAPSPPPHHPDPVRSAAWLMLTKADAGSRSGGGGSKDGSKDGSRFQLLKRQLAASFSSSETSRDSRQQQKVGKCGS